MKIKHCIIITILTFSILGNIEAARRSDHFLNHSEICSLTKKGSSHNDSLHLQNGVIKVGACADVPPVVYSFAKFHLDPKNLAVVSYVQYDGKLVGQYITNEGYRYIGEVSSGVVKLGDEEFDPIETENIVFKSSKDDVSEKTFYHIQLHSGYQIPVLVDDQCVTIDDGWKKTRIEMKTIEELKCDGYAIINGPQERIISGFISDKVLLAREPYSDEAFEIPWGDIRSIRKDHQEYYGLRVVKDFGSRWTVPILSKSLEEITEVVTARFEPMVAEISPCVHQIACVISDSTGTYESKELGQRVINPILNLFVKASVSRLVEGTRYSKSIALRDRTKLTCTVTEEENGSDFENFSERGMVHTSEEKLSIDESIFPSRTVQVNFVRSLSPSLENMIRQSALIVCRGLPPSHDVEVENLSDLEEGQEVAVVEESEELEEVVAQVEEKKYENPSLMIYISKYAELLPKERADKLNFFPTIQTPLSLEEKGGFWVDVHEVTNAEYADFVSEIGCNAPKYWIENEVPYGLEDDPVVDVSYEDAKAYASWKGKRLPTLAEWGLAIHTKPVSRVPYIYVERVRYKNPQLQQLPLTVRYFFEQLGNTSSSYTDWGIVDNIAHDSSSTVVLPSEKGQPNLSTGIRCVMD